MKRRLCFHALKQALLNEQTGEQWSCGQPTPNLFCHLQTVSDKGFYFLSALTFIICLLQHWILTLLLRFYCTETENTAP